VSTVGTRTLLDTLEDIFPWMTRAERMDHVSRAEFAALNMPEADYDERD